jgi:hypothetical protein
MATLNYSDCVSTRAYMSQNGKVESFDLKNKNGQEVDRSAKD